MVQGQIAKGAIISYVAIFINIAITFFYTPWMIRQIGVSDYGLYSLIGAFVSYFIVDFGLTGSITRFIAKYRAEGQQQKVENTLGLTMKIFLTIDTIIFVLLFVCYFFLNDIFKGLTPEELEKLKVLYIIAGTFSVFTFVWHPMNGAMMAYEYFVENRLIDIIQRVGTVVLIVIVLYVKGDVNALVFITGASGFVTSLLKYIVFKRKSKIKENWHFFDKLEMKSLMAFSLWVFIIGLAQRFRLSLMPTLLGIFSNSIEISVFSLGMTMEGMVYTLSSALNGLFLPKVTRMIQDKSDRGTITNLMIRVGRIQLFIIALILLGFWLVGDVFLNLWVGEVFNDTYYVVILLTITNIVSLTQQIASDVIYADDKVRFSAIVTFVSSFVCFLLAITMVSSLGAIGCALAFGVSMIVNLLILNIFYKKKMELDVVKFFKQCHLRILPALVLLTILAIAIKRIVIVDTWPKLVVFTIGYSLIYITISYFFLMNKEEKQLLKFIKR